MQVIPDEIYELILDDLTSGLTHDGKERLTQWKNASEANRQAWEEVCRVWMMGRQMAEDQNDLAKRAQWSSIALKVQQKQQEKRRWIHRWIGIAASLILITGSFWAYKNLESSSPQTLAITLPEEGPTITVEDGRVFTISELQNQESSGMRFDSLNAVSYAQYLAKMPQAVHELSVPKGGKYQIELSDGTRVTVNAESRLKYAAEFEGEIREVWLQGEAFFEVARDPSHPFLVHTGDLTTQVLGTKFNVMAYANEEQIKVTLTEGSVRVKDSLQSQKIVPGEQAVYSLSGEQAIQVTQVDVQYVTGWTKDILYFDDVTLDELLKQLHRWYSFDATFADESVKTRHFTGGIQKKHDARKIFSMIEKVNDVKFNVKDKEVIISKK